MNFTHPDFTPPALIDGAWQSNVFLPQWVGYKKPGPFIHPLEGPSYFAYRPFDGNVEVMFDTNEKLTPDWIVRPEQYNAIAFLLGNQEAIFDTMLAGIIKYYRQLRTKWIKHDPRCAEFLPKVKEMGDFRQHIGRPALTVLEVFKDEIAYCGFSLYCEWDNEHGLGVLMHKNRIIEISDYGIAVDTWTARIHRDGKNKKREREKLHAENKKRWEERQKQG